MRGARVRVVEPTQYARRCDLRVVSVRHRLKSRLNWVWNMLPEPLMRSKVIVEADVFLHHSLQVSPVQNEHVIKAILAT